MTLYSMFQSQPLDCPSPWALPGKLTLLFGIISQTQAGPVTVGFSTSMVKNFEH